MSIVATDRLRRIEELSQRIDVENKEFLKKLTLLKEAFMRAPVATLIYEKTHKEPIQNSRAQQELGAFSSLPLTEWRDYGEFIGISNEKLNGNFAGVLLSSIKSGNLIFKFNKNLDNKFSAGQELKFRIFEVLDNEGKWLGLVLYAEREM